MGITKQSYRSVVHESRSPTLVRAARLFFFGGSRTSSSALGAPPRSATEDEVLRLPNGFSSTLATLAAGVKGGSMIRSRLAGTTGVTAGDTTLGRDEVVTEGVDIGVATVEFAKGTE